MISCQIAKELINLDVDEKLITDKKSQLDEHLAECKNCLEYSHDLVRLHNNLLQLPKINLNESIVDDLIGRNILEVTETKPASIFRGFRAWYGIAAAAILLLIYIPLFGLNNGDKDFSMESAEAPYAALADQQRVDEDVANSDSTVAAKNSDELEFNSTALDGSTPNEESNYAGALSDDNYRIEIQDNQLMIYDQNNIEVFKTDKWSDDLTVEWSIEKNNLISYYLYDIDKQVVAKYRIDLIEKKEEIIEE